VAKLPSTIDAWLAALREETRRSRINRGADPCKPGADELGENFAREAVDVQDCFGGTERTAGEQSECSALFAAETVLSRRHGECVRFRRHRGKSPEAKAPPVKAGPSQGR
jgi:hypothetical protein